MTMFLVNVLFISMYYEIKNMYRYKAKDQGS